MWKELSLAIVAGVGLSSAAMAASCREELARFAQQYNLAADLPRAEPPAGATERPATQESRGIPPSDTLARSGGVVAPPEGGRSLEIEPPSTGPSSTPTLSQVRPHTSAQPSTSATELSGAKRAQMEALVQSARGAEAQGDEAECFRRLGEARAIPQSG